MLHKSAKYGSPMQQNYSAIADKIKEAGSYAKAGDEARKKWRKKEHRQMKKEQAQLIKKDPKRSMYVASDTTDAMKIAQDQRETERGFSSSQFLPDSPTSEAYKNPAAMDIYSTTYKSKAVKEASYDYEIDPARGALSRLKKQQKLNIKK